MQLVTYAKQQGYVLKLLIVIKGGKVLKIFSSEVLKCEHRAGSQNVEDRRCYENCRFCFEGLQKLM